MTPERVVRFDDFELDRHTFELRRGGVPVRLQQQPARVLAVLLEHAGDLVEREALRDMNEDAARSDEDLRVNPKRSAAAAEVIAHDAIRFGDECQE